MNTGVYCWLNKRNGKRYVGSASRSFRSRKADHILLLNSGKHFNIYLQRAWVKYGQHAFVFQVLERCKPGKCLEREQYWMDLCESANLKHGYNLCRTAGSVLGMRWTRDPKSYDWMKDPEWIEGLRRRGTGRKHSLKTRRKMSKSMTGIPKGPMSKEHKAKIAESCTGLKQSEETRAKKSAALKGRPKSEEARRKMSESAKRRGTSEKQYQTLLSNAEKSRGKPRPLSVRLKISASHKGKVFSAEHIENMRKAQRARQERERQSQ